MKLKLKMDKKIIDQIRILLENVEFIDVATSSSMGQPNAAPKFLLKIQDTKLYLVDCVMGTTWDNIKINPSVSIPVMNVDTLLGYRINGSAYVVEEGLEKSELMKEFGDKQVKLSTERIVESIRSQKGKRNLEVQFPETVGMFMVEVESVVEIGPTGRLVRESI